MARLGLLCALACVVVVASEHHSEKAMHHVAKSGRHNKAFRHGERAAPAPGGGENPAPGGGENPAPGGGGAPAPGGGGAPAPGDGGAPAPAPGGAPYIPSILSGPGSERRRDVTDGGDYTMQEFYAHTKKEINMINKLINK